MRLGELSHTCAVAWKWEMRPVIQPINVTNTETVQRLGAFAALPVGKAAAHQVQILHQI